MDVSDEYIAQHPAGPVQITEDDPYDYEPGWYVFGWVNTGKPAPFDKTLDLFGPYATEQLAQDEIDRSHVARR